MKLLPDTTTTFRSDRAWAFGLSPDELWPHLVRLEDYRDWWPWLVRFDPIGGFQAGARWDCTVTPPLPYDVRFSVLLDHVEPERVAAARVVGDIRGDATLTLEATDDGCVARLRSDLAPANPLLRGVGVAARPLIEWGHDWVLDQGRAQFVGRALPPED